VTGYTTAIKDYYQKEKRRSREAEIELESFLDGYRLRYYRY
jgi:hypothetical protein